MRVEKPGNKAFPTEPQDDATSVEIVEISEHTSPEVGAPRARAGTERGWGFEAERTAPEAPERTIVGPAPPAPRTDASTPAVRRKARRLVALPSLQLVRDPRPIANPPFADQAPVTVPPPSARGSRPRVTAVASGELSVPPVQAEPPGPPGRLDDGWTLGDEPAPPRLPSQRVAAARSATGGFPRSAAERAGASAAEAEAAEPVAPLRVAPPRLPELPVRQAPRLAQGSVSAPLPDMSELSAPLPARRRPPTVEFPTLDEDDLEADMDPPSDYTLIDPTHAAAPEIPVPRPLPSIYAVVDRRPAPLPRAPERPAVRVEAPIQLGRAPASAVPTPASPGGKASRLPARPRKGPEPLAPEVVAAPRALQPAQRAAVGRSRPGARLTSSRPSLPERPVRRAATPRPQSAAFSESEAAFFAAGEELENAGQDALLDDELDGAPRPTLWRRLTGRHARLRR